MSPVTTKIRHSGLQIEVINFYRKCFRAIRKKPLETRNRFRNFVRTQFQQHNLLPKDHSAIEYLLRRGKRQLEADKTGGEIYSLK
ncbi:1556_t:CDS:2 [Diversispora eburnea]|uniref:1556_t:CDS:1 n=1 Tax=Diversispora eburnea TaxID=1213867 RepID=A0A9N8YJV9_9GLOM|nr:1556_t:CDS:2 [Diversispora eburnea]